MIKRLNYKENFEDLYLRHDYIRKCDKLDGELVKEYAPVVKSIAHSMYNKLYPNYNKVGFDRDDILSIANVYMLSYMGLYSLRFNEEEREGYIQDHLRRFNRRPNEAEIYTKDKNNMANFLRQRLRHCCTVCSRKARNITVGSDSNGYFAHTDKSISAPKDLIIRDYKRLGYRKITISEYKELKKEAQKANSSVIIDKDGFEVMSILIFNTGINDKDYTEIIYSNTDKFTLNPEQIYIKNEENMIAEGFREKFLKMPYATRRKTLKQFIKDNKNNKYMKDELTFARKVLRNPKIMV